MKRILWCLGLGLPTAVLWACSADSQMFYDTHIGGSDAGRHDARVDQRPLACGDAAAAPARVLLVQGGATGSELAAINLETSKVDGRLRFDGGYGLTSSPGSDPYLLGGESDLVTRLDANEPWKTVATWDVHGDDALPSGDPNANPVGVVQVSCSKAYVLRYNRNRIAVIDPSQPSTPPSYIDLTDLKEPTDPNMLEMTSAVYVPAKKRVYVLLGNIDFTTFVKVGGIGKLVCTSLKPSVIAIDVETDKVVNLHGTARGGGIALDGYNPPLGVPLVYDANADRVFVLEGGCNADVGDGGPGDMSRRRVEEVNLGTGAVKTLLSLDDRGFPASLAVATAKNAALSFFYDGYHWDPRTTSLGAQIDGGMDLIATDGHGAYVGARQYYFDDGGLDRLQVVSVPADGSEPTVVKENPFTSPSGYVAGIEAWPHQ